MSIHRWPDTLPGPSAPGFGLSPVDPSVRTPMEVGAQRTRRRTLSRLDRVTMEWRFKDTEMAAFRSWYDSLQYSLLGSSDDLSIWNTLTNVTKSTGGGISPDGLAIDRILETATTAVHRLTRSDVDFALDGANLMFSATIKTVGRTLGRLDITDRNGVSLYSEFDLAAGTLGAQSGLISRAIKDRGNGWYRVTISANIGVGVSTPSVIVRLRDGTGALSYLGDSTKGFDVCETQVRFSTGNDLFLPTDTDGTVLGAAGGSAWFFTNIATGGGLVNAEARFTGPYKAVAKAALNWIVTGEVEVRNA